MRKGGSNSRNWFLFLQLQKEKKNSRFFIKSTNESSEFHFSINLFRVILVPSFRNPIDWKSTSFVDLEFWWSWVHNLPFKWKSANRFCFGSQTGLYLASVPGLNRKNNLKINGKSKSCIFMSATFNILGAARRRKNMRGFLLCACP